MAHHRRKRAGRRAGTFRTCLGCRQTLRRQDTVRLVLGTQGEVLPDLFGKLTGRGAHLCPDLRCFRRAVESRALSRALHGSAQLESPELLANRLLQAWHDQILAILAVAVRAGAVKAGRTVVEQALAGRQASMVILAEDAGEDLRSQILQLTSRQGVRCHVLLAGAELSRFHHGKALSVLAVTHRGISQRLEQQIEKVSRLNASMNIADSKPLRHLTAQDDCGKMPQQPTGTKSDRSRAGTIDG